MFPMSCAPFPFLTPASTLRTTGPLLHWQPSSLLLTWSSSHQQHYNGVWRGKAFNCEAGSFELHHFQPVQTGDVWLSLHLMSKQTSAACRCWGAICCFPFTFYLQLNKSQGHVEYRRSVYVHWVNGSSTSCHHFTCTKFARIHNFPVLSTVTSSTSLFNFPVAPVQDDWSILPPILWWHAHRCYWCCCVTL